MAQLGAMAGMDMAQLGAMMNAYGLGGMGMNNFGGQAQVPSNFRPGDWMCQQCGNHNYASRTQCGKCNAPKALSMGGMGAMGMSNLPSGFRPGDWMCKCGNHNYATREACGRCKTPKAEAMAAK